MVVEADLNEGCTSEVLWWGGATKKDITEAIREDPVISISDQRDSSQIQSNNSKLTYEDCAGK